MRAGILSGVDALTRRVWGVAQGDSAGPASAVRSGVTSVVPQHGRAVYYPHHSTAISLFTRYYRPGAVWPPTVTRSAGRQ